MCGLIGAFAPDGAIPEGFANGLSSIRHRGPDGEGWYRDHACVLGHRRLSIVDLVGGDQPLHNEDETIALIYNGEIYNHREILSSLNSSHRPMSRSDGEALVHAYEESGVDAIAKMRGMFALALWDGRRLVLARDPLGIKPLYWSRSGGAICFASEIKALLPWCPAESIERFPAGHWFSSDRGLVPFWQLGQQSDPVSDSESIESWSRKVLERLDLAVRSRLMADVPIGVFLSGGLDSSLIAALMARHQKPLHSFAVGLADSDDLRFARSVALHLGTIHHEVMVDEGQLIDALGQVVWHLESDDADLLRSALPTWFLSHEAARHVKVVLTGEGADELFGGYDYHAAYKDHALNRELARSVRELDHINLQRVDRMSMAHGLEARVPFLDVEVVRLAMMMPAAVKRRHGIAKFVLRLAAQEILPREIVWREKSQFDRGTGVTAALRRHFGTSMNEHRRYHELFTARFPPVIRRLVARWREGRLPC